MDEPRCALALFPSQGKEGDRDKLLWSLQRAKEVGLGDLAEVDPIDVRAGSMMNALAEAGERASREGFAWLLAVGAAEVLVPDIFVKTAPALRINDAVWGAAALASDTRKPPKVERITRLAAQDLPTFFHAALRWWIGPTHFVRPALAAEAAASSASQSYADYLYFLWKNHRAYKTAQALTLFRGNVPLVGEADCGRLIEILEREPAFMPVRFGPATFWLPYTGLNPVIEREQMRGLFFEHEELDFLAARLPSGLRIVDVGANTGNHTVFFAGPMRAASVVPIEPLPRAVAALRAAVAENRLGNVDLSCLGMAVGAEEGRLRPIPSATAGLGATHFVEDSLGEVPLVTLDRLIRGRVDFIKIDVEGMEMEALSGAAGLIAANRPVLYVEVLDAAIGRFMAWVDGHQYRIERLFPDKTHCNYLLVPAERPSEP
ncbi:MAG: FkbM family methyltransferase [Propylenella sp.]